MRRDLAEAIAIHNGQWMATNHDGVYERFHSDDGERFHIEKIQDVEPILNRNQALRNHNDGFNSDRTGRRIASIPMVIYHQWLQEGFDALDPANDAELRRRLSSSDWMKLRTSEGRL